MVMSGHDLRKSQLNRDAMVNDNGTEPDAPVQEALPSENVRRKLVCSVTCGDCAGFDSLAIYSKPCEQLGVLKWANPCPKFILNAFAINLADEASLQLLRVIAQIKDKHDVRRLSALLIQNSVVVKHKFRLGQIVVIPILTGDYVSNYARAILIGGNSSHAFLRALTVSKKVKSTAFRAQVHWESVLSLSAWVEKKKQLTAAGKLRDPKYERMIGTKAPLVAQMRKEDYKPASISAKTESKTNRRGRPSLIKVHRTATNEVAVAVRDSGATSAQRTKPKRQQKSI